MQDVFEHTGRISTFVRRSPRQQLEQDGTDPVDVGVLAGCAARLLRGHVGRSSDCATILGVRRCIRCNAPRPVGRTTRTLDFRIIRITCKLGEPPVQQDHFAELTKHNIAGLEIAVHHAARMRVTDRIADPDNGRQQARQF